MEGRSIPQDTAGSSSIYGWFTYWIMVDFPSIFHSYMKNHQWVFEVIFVLFLSIHHTCLTRSHVIFVPSYTIRSIWKLFFQNICSWVFVCFTTGIGHWLADLDDLSLQVAIKHGSHTVIMTPKVFVCWYQYPLVNYHNYGKSPFSMGKSTINCHFQ